MSDLIEKVEHGIVMTLLVAMLTISAPRHQ
jgi:hypothetical protein